MKPLAPDSPLIQTYRTERVELNKSGHAFPEGATGDANGLIGRCENCGETVFVRPSKADGIQPVRVGPHGPCEGAR
jgi:hypothetical protein